MKFSLTKYRTLARLGYNSCRIRWHILSVYKKWFTWQRRLKIDLSPWKTSVFFFFFTLANCSLIGAWSYDSKFNLIVTKMVHYFHQIRNVHFHQIWHGYFKFFTCTEYHCYRVFLRLRGALKSNQKKYVYVYGRCNYFEPIFTTFNKYSLSQNLMLCTKTDFYFPLTGKSIHFFFFF